MTRTHPVADDAAHAQAVSEYVTAGYEIAHEGDGRTVLVRVSNGSLLAHLALFFTIGWLTFALLNVWYIYRCRKKSKDRVEVVTQ